MSCKTQSWEVPVSDLKAAIKQADDAGNKGVVFKIESNGKGNCSLWIISPNHSKAPDQDNFPPPQGPAGP
jgi:hypothetical protein